MPGLLKNDDGVFGAITGPSPQDLKCNRVRAKSLL
ncbi:unnamed protein product [Amoebophrya sp. A120]|nr:unnamed protein product [Amoebophrya sp. A120]|eukprot:GSA120T00002797001.1